MMKLDGLIDRLKHKKDISLISLEGEVRKDGRITPVRTQQFNLT